MKHIRLHTPVYQLVLTCPLSTYSVRAGFYISLSNHLLSPWNPPECPSERPVSYEVQFVFITSVTAAAFSLSSQLLWRAAAPVLSNLDIISVTCSVYAASWADTAVRFKTSPFDLNVIRKPHSSWVMLCLSAKLLTLPHLNHSTCEILLL